MVKVVVIFVLRKKWSWI